jgi:predicted DNA-binding transcriptional regulator AlpA
MDTTMTILTEAEAAKKIDAEPQTLRKWRARRKGPPYLKLGGKVRYSLADIEKFIQESRVVPSDRKRRRRGAP